VGFGWCVQGWPVPDMVKFHTARLLGGNWEPYPIDMSFEPPCMVLSTIGLAQPGKIETASPPHPPHTNPHFTKERRQLRCRRQSTTASFAGGN
jgi:hypothetical protein